MPFSIFHKLAALIVMIALATSLSRAADITPAELISRHLDSIGSPEARNVKSRVVQGLATYRIYSGGSGAIDGKAVFATEGRKSNFLFKINTNGYRGEQFICSGDKTSIAGTYSDKTRSELGDFLLSQDIMLRESLIGGVLSSGWPLLNVEEHKAHVHFEGS